MTAHSPKTNGQFLSLRLQSLRTLFLAYDREIEAKDLAQPDKAKALYIKREEIRALLLELRRAETVFKTSPLSTKTAEQRLGEAVLNLKRARLLLTRPATGLDGASAAVDVLTDLSGRLK